MSEIRGLTMHGRFYGMIDRTIELLEPGKKAVFICPTLSRAKTLATMIRSRYHIKAKTRKYTHRGQPIVQVLDEFSDNPHMTLVPNDSVSFVCEVWKNLHSWRRILGKIK